MYTYTLHMHYVRISNSTTESHIQYAKITTHDSFEAVVELCTCMLLNSLHFCSSNISCGNLRPSTLVGCTRADMCRETWSQESGDRKWPHLSFETWPEILWRFFVTQDLFSVSSSVAWLGKAVWELCVSRTRFSRVLKRTRGTVAAHVFVCSGFYHSVYNYVPGTCGTI